MDDTFLLRRIQYTPCFVKIYCDIPIKFLQEVYFKSIIYLPKAIFNKKCFSNYQVKDDYIKIDIGEWTNFLNDLMKVYNGYNIDKITNNIIKKLKNFSNNVNDCFDNRNISRNKMKILLDNMALVDSFAIFNMFLPIEKYNLELKEKNLKYNVEDIMVCSFEPHRIQLRKNKLNLAIKYGKNTIKEKDYLDYYNNYVFYEEFEKWIFDIDKYLNRNYLIRELKNTLKKYSIEELQKEIKNINASREMCFNRSLEFIEKIDENDIKKYSFLSIIVSEEEKRHMIECKLLLLIGIVYKDIDIDIGRSSIDELLNAIERR